MRTLFVRRRALDDANALIASLQHALATERATNARMGVEADALRRERERAEQRAELADTRAVTLLTEARTALGDAASVTKMAAEVLFAVPSGDVDPAPTVLEADRAAARRARDAEATRR